MKQSLKFGAFVLLNPINDNVLSYTILRKKVLKDEDILKRLLSANDLQVDKLLPTINAGKLSLTRKIGYDFAQLSASFCSPESKYFHSPLVISALEKLAQLLINFQSEDGTVNIGNLESPPDTAFLLEPLSAGAFLLLKNNATILRNVNVEIYTQEW